MRLQPCGLAVVRVSGQGEDIGATFAVLSKFAKIEGPDNLLRGMAMLREQMKGVPGGLQDFMEAAAPLVSSYTMQGHSGLDALRDIGALYATIRPGMAAPKQARGAVEEFLAKIADKDTALRLESLGGDVFGHTLGEKNANYEKTTRLPIGQILQGLLVRYQDRGMAPVLDKVLGLGLRHALKVPLGEVKDSGSSPTLNLKLAAGGDTAKFLAEVAAASRTYSASLAGLRASLQKVGDQVLATPLRWMADMVADNTTAVGRFVVGIGLLSGLAVGIRWLKWLSATFPFVRLGALAAGAAVGNFFIAIRAGYGIMAAFGLVLAANPIGLWITAISALVGLGFLIYEKWEPIVALFRELRDLVPPWVRELLPTAGSNGFSAFDPAKRPLIYGSGSAPGMDGRDGRRDVGGQITVRFDNAPPGMRVSEVKSDNALVNYMLDVGYALGAP